MDVKKLFSSQGHRLYKVDDLLRQLIEDSSREGVISFAAGSPSIDNLPITEMREAANAVLNPEGKYIQAVGYNPVGGSRGLRAFVAKMYSENIGTELLPEDILAFDGSQPAIYSLGEVFLDHDDVVMTSDPTYVGAVSVFELEMARMVSTESDGEGVIVDENFSRSLSEIGRQRKIKFAYVMPRGANPDGSTLTEERKQIILEAARENGILVVEDDSYGNIQLREGLGKNLSMQSYAKGDEVVSLFSMSKIWAPGARISFAIARNPDLRKALTSLEAIKGLSNESINKAFLLYWLENYRQGEFLQRISRGYAHLKDVMREACMKHLPKDVAFNDPDYGFFLWAEVPRVDTHKLYPLSIKKGVVYAPGNFFCPKRGENDPNVSCNYRMRLSFSNFRNGEEGRIFEGARRLGAAIEEYREKGMGR